jgi:hypothetical protein
MLHLKLLEKQEQTKPKTRVGIHEIEAKKKKYKESIKQKAGSVKK